MTRSRSSREREHIRKLDVIQSLKQKKEFLSEGYEDQLLLGFLETNKNVGEDLEMHILEAWPGSLASRGHTT